MRVADLELPREADGPAGKDEGKGAAQVAEHHGDNGDPDEDAVVALARCLQQAQVADEQRDLEEADAELVYRAAGKVDLFVRRGVSEIFGAQLDGQPQAVLCLDDGQDRVYKGEDKRGGGDPVVGHEAAAAEAQPQAEADDGKGDDGEDDADGDNGPPLRDGVQLGCGMGHPSHG